MPEDTNISWNCHRARFDGDTMKIYLAGPLFALSELDFNHRLRNLLEEEGHRVWLPQEQTSMSQDATSILSKLLSGLYASDVIIANMDGAARLVPADLNAAASP